MSASAVFFDTNILLYTLSGDAAKADRAEELLNIGGIVSVQVLNEFTSVARRNLGMDWREVREIIGTFRGLCEVVPLTLDVHDRGLDLAERFGFSIYDALIVAAAVIVGAEIMYTEDLQHGQRIENRLVITDPFKALTDV